MCINYQGKFKSDLLDFTNENLSHIFDQKIKLLPFPKAYPKNVENKIISHLKDSKLTNLNHETVKMEHFLKWS